MPFKNEHAARQTEPSQYKEFRRYTPKGFPAGITTILGIDADGKTEIQSLRADKDKFTPSEFKKWLKDHDFNDDVEEAQIEKGFFATWIPLNAMKKASDDPTQDNTKGFIAGIVSTDDVDFEGERILQDGLDWSYFKKHGWFNYEHQPGAAAVLGHPTKIERIDEKSTRVEGCLYLDKPLAKDCYETAIAMEKAGGERSLGFSIEGKVVLRDPMNPKKVLKANVINVAVTAHPVNPNTNLEVIAKSMGADVGYQEASIPDADASMSALVEQSLEGKMSNSSYGKDKKAKTGKTMTKTKLKDMLSEHFSNFSSDELERLANLLMQAAKNRSQVKPREYD